MHGAAHHIHGRHPQRACMSQESQGLGAEASQTRGPVPGRSDSFTSAACSACSACSACCVLRSQVMQTQAGILKSMEAQQLEVEVSAIAR